MALPGVDAAATADYRSRLATLLDAGDARVTDAYEDWRAHVRRHHGAVFETRDERREDAAEPATSEEVSPRDLFLDALSFDAAATTLGRAVATACDVVVDAPADALDFAAVHEAVGTGLVDVDVDAGVDPEDVTTAGVDDIRRLYERTVPTPSRRVFGEYYTPPGLAELGVDAVTGRVDDVATATVVDPGCGAGAFLTAALRRKRQASPREDVEGTLDRLTSTVVGVDVNPVAVAAARTAYLLELVPLVRAREIDRVSIPVYLGDALGLDDAAPVTGVEGQADVLLGNPPWIPWERLADAQKDRLRQGPIDRLDLFAYEGAAARLGHANDDLSLPFVWTCLDRFLEGDGVAAFVLKRGFLRGPAGRLLRSGRVGSRALSVEHVHDVAAVDPFAGVDAAAALYVFRVGRTDEAEPTDSASDDGGPTPRPTATDPVPSTEWEPTAAGADLSSVTALRETTTRTETALRPVDPEDPAGPWHRTDAAVDALGSCAYRIRHGVKDDAKAVFSVDEDRLAELEPTHVYPYLRSKHVVKWGLFGYDRFLVPQRRAGADNEDALRRETPATYDHLRRHRDRLEARKSSWFDAGPFYSLFGLGPYTWAPYKVVWCRLGFKPHFAVVSTVDDPVLGEKTVVPGDHCMFVACESEREAHYLCGLLNAAPYQDCLRDVAGEGKASLTKSVVSSLALPLWEGTPRQRRLVSLSRQAHDIVPAYTDRSKRAYNRLSIPELDRVERTVDAVATEFLAER